MSAFDALKYMQTLESMLRITEQAWLMDEEFLGILDKLNKVLGITKTEMQVSGEGEPEVLVLYDEKTESAGCTTYDFTSEDQNVRCLMYTKQTESEYSAELLAGLNTVYDILKMMTVRELGRRREERNSKIDRVTGVSTKAVFTEYAAELFKNGSIMDYEACGFSLRGMAELNRQVGKDNGNRLMAAYVKNLQMLLGEDGIVARTGGIYFSALFKKDRFEEIAVYLSGKVVTAEESTESKLMSACVGFYPITESCTSAERLNEIIAAALHNVLKNPAQPFIIYDERLQQADEDEKYIAEIFQEALDKEEFVVYYQPKVDLKKYRLNGSEALCRWFHDGKMVLPYRFIPVLENNGDIVKLDYYMIDHVCRDISRWIDEGRQVVPVSVNLSRCHLGDPDLLTHITDIIDQYGVPHRLVEIELTETTTDVDYQKLKKLVTGLREGGFSTSVDDFGVGYSSMNLLHEFPWSVIKIDRSFIPVGDGSMEDEKRKVMLRSIIDMVNSLELKCIAEGVETAEQVILLKENGCYRAQGYYFDKPMPIEDYELRLDQL